MKAALIETVSDPSGGETAELMCDIQWRNSKTSMTCKTLVFLLWTAGNYLKNQKLPVRFR